MKLWKVGTLLNKVKVYEDDRFILGLTFVKVSGKDGSIKCGASFKIKLKVPMNNKFYLRVYSITESLQSGENKDINYLETTFDIPASKAEHMANAILPIDCLDYEDVVLQFAIENANATTFSKELIVKLPISMLKFVNLADCKNVQAFDEDWNSRLAGAEYQLAQSAEASLDTNYVTSCAELQFYFPGCSILRNQECGLIL